MGRFDAEPGEVIGTDIDPAVAGGVSQEFVNQVLDQHNDYEQKLDDWRADLDDVHKQIALIVSHTELLNTIKDTVLPLIGKAISAKAPVQGASFISNLTNKIGEVTTLVNTLKGFKSILPPIPGLPI